METKTKDVKSKGKVVGVATYTVWDSVAEVIEARGEEPVLSLVNAQERTNEMNKIRSLATGKPSKELINRLAMQKILTEYTAELSTAAGDEGALQRLIDRVSKEVEAGLQAERETAAVGAVAAAEAGDTEDEEDDDDDLDD